MSPFKQKIIEIVSLIPAGKVVSYGQVAAYAGLPRAAREVGWVLNGIENDVQIPWWRVVNNKGYLSIRGSNTNDKSLQRKLLEAEKIIINEDFELDMDVYRYKMPATDMKRLQLSDTYIEKLLEKYNK